LRARLRRENLLAVNASLIMTVLGPDRPGHVEAIASLVTAHGGNWLESRMARLASQFAGIVHVEIPEDAVQTLSAELAKLRDRGLTVIVEKERAAEATSRRTLRIDLEGQDRPGIVKEISAVLARLGCSVDELETERRSAPMSGEALFLARAEVHLPEDVTAATVRKAIESLATDLMVDVALTERTGTRAGR
jgi:glycine cleavage system regulatory protein